MRARSSIAGDLEAAQKARAAADETEAAWRARMDAARAEAARHRAGSEGRQSGRDTEAKVKAAADKINLKVESAQAADPRRRSAAARSEIESVAAEATQEMVERADRHHGRREGGRRGGEGGAECLSALLIAVAAEALEAAEPTAFGLNPGGWVALAMLVVFALLIWKKVPGAIGRALDSKIALIRDQLAEAESLRKEAEALKAEYEAKATSADKDREALLERARHEADEIVAKAKTDAEALIERRTRMAEDKIAAEERTAIEQLRAAAADAATKAAAQADRRAPRRRDRRQAGRSGDQGNRARALSRYCWCWPPGSLTPSSASLAAIAVGLAAEVAEADDAAQPFVARR